MIRNNTEEKERKDEMGSRNVHPRNGAAKIIEKRKAFEREKVKNKVTPDTFEEQIAFDCGPESNEMTRARAACFDISMREMKAKRKVLEQLQQNEDGLRNEEATSTGVSVSGRRRKRRRLVNRWGEPSQSIQYEVGQVVKVQWRPEDIRATNARVIDDSVTVRRHGENSREMIVGEDRRHRIVHILGSNDVSSVASQFSSGSSVAGADPVGSKATEMEQESKTLDSDAALQRRAQVSIRPLAPLWCLDRPGPSTMKTMGLADGPWWLCRTKKNCRIINPPAKGLPLETLKEALRNWSGPDGPPYLGGTRPCVVDNEENWIRCCVKPTENPSDWSIVMVSEELERDGTSHGWFKVVLRNKRSGLYSIRSFTQNKSFFKGSHDSQYPGWRINLGKPLTDASFWLRLKELLIPTDAS